MKTAELMAARDDFDKLRKHLEEVHRTASVLLVEDDRNDVELVKKKLQPFHLSLEVVRDSLEAIEQLKARAYDIVFLDLRLPGSSGLDVLRYAKLQSVKTIFIVLTGVDDFNPMIKEALAEGASFVLQKPITNEHLNVIFGAIT